MTQEERRRRLLLTDLCARLPYGVKVQDDMGRIDGLTIGHCDLIDLYYNEDEVCTIFPLLRPMESMTEEEKEWYYLYGVNNGTCTSSCAAFVIDWLLKNHFDFRGLIPNGLAIAVTEENNPYKEL